VSLTESGPLPAGVTFTDHGDGTAGLAGTPVPGSAGTYALTITATNAFGQDTQSFTLTVSRRAAFVRLSPSNPHAVAVTKNGVPAVTITARITDASPAPYADITSAVPATLELLPIGPGGTSGCSPTVTKVTAATVTTPGSVDVSCTFPAKSLNINVFDVRLTVSTLTFSGVNDSALTVYDPSSGGATGGGVVINPTTGRVASFGFTAVRLKSGGVSGKYLYVEADDVGNQYIVKGNNIDTMATVAGGGGTTAIITGKATYQAVGNYSFQLTALDGGASDTYGQRINAPVGAPSGASISFSPVAVSGAVNVAT
jgi:hypothetical protein